MRRMLVLAAAGSAAVASGLLTFTISRMRAAKEPTAISSRPASEPEVTGTIALQSILPPADRLAEPPQPASRTATISETCSNRQALGVGRVVEIDTVGGPGFGFEHFKAHDFLRENEVVLTLDDGPWPTTTPAVLRALAAQCTRATFFAVGKHALWHPEVLKQVA